jgi:hypothetical protein
MKRRMKQDTHEREAQMESYLTGIPEVMGATNQEDRATTITSTGSNIADHRLRVLHLSRGA